MSASASKRAAEAKTYTYEQVATTLGVDTAHVSELVRCGKLRTVADGRIRASRAQMKAAADFKPVLPIDGDTEAALEWMRSRTAVHVSRPNGRYRVCVPIAVGGARDFYDQELAGAVAAALSWLVQEIAERENRASAARSAVASP